MAERRTINNRMRIYHRYLGFFLAGIMAVYSLSGIVLIFRDTDFLKKENHISKHLTPNLTPDSLGKAIGMRDLKILSLNGSLQIFKQGTYDSVSGDTKYTVKALPQILQKLTKLHKANTKDPLFFLNGFFGLSLFFFVLSSFWMFLPKTRIFRKGLIYTVAGIILTIIMLMW